MPVSGPTKAELQDMFDELQQRWDEVGDRISDMLNPVLSREQVLELVQEVDELMNGAGDDDEDEESDDDEISDEDDEDEEE
jgi:hypothetical protein